MANRWGANAPTPWKAASSWAAPPCNGCAMSLGYDRRSPPTSKPWQPAVPDARWRGDGAGLRGNGRTPLERPRPRRGLFGLTRGSGKGPPGPGSCTGQPSPTRPWTLMRAMEVRCRCAPSQNCAWMAARPSTTCFMQTQSDLLGVRRGPARSHGDHRTGRGLPGRPRRGLSGATRQDIASHNGTAERTFSQPELADAERSRPQTISLAAGRTRQHWIWAEDR